MQKFCLILAAFAGLHTAALAQSVLNLSPTRVLGQPSVNFRSTSPNVVEGRELYSPLDVAVDTSSTPRPIYVADLSNHRVLGWRDSASFTNGAFADFVLGQIDKVSTVPQGPSVQGSSRSLGFNNPNSVAVDRKGNVYVADSGNNRILRFPKSEIFNSDIPTPDLVLGQPGFTTATNNQGGISELSLNLSGSARSDMVVDSRGNLWVTDTGNNRVLRYPAAALDAPSGRVGADVVLGQTNFTTGTLPTDPPGTTQSTINALNKSILKNPFSLAIDSDGRLYVGDEFQRVLVYLPDLLSGKAASRIAGIEVLPAGQQARVDELVVAVPSGLFTVGNRLGVVDFGLSRITLYDPFPDWPAESETQISPAAKVVIGQQNFNRFEANRGLAEPAGNTLRNPSQAFYVGPDLYVADTGNNRVIALPDVTASAVATRVLGQTAMNFNAPNLTVGREMFLYAGLSNTSNLSGNFSDGGGIAIDNSTPTPRLYVADTFNNRILGYKDARSVRPGDAADIVIGQSDFQRTLINAPFNDSQSWNETGLYRPSGLAVDANGDLYVADSGNGRVLRFPKPFEQTVPAGERRRANLVLGQLSFTQKITDPSARNMAYPFGLAFTVEGSLVVSDAIHSRLLFFRRPANGDFTNGQAAERVIGQSDFFTVGGGTTGRRMNSPRHIAIDTDDRLYVADAGNNRVLVYNRITVGGNDPEPAFLLTGVNSPQGIWVSPLTGEIWVANTRGNAASRFPRFERLAIDPRLDYNIPSAAPLALTQDSSGNLYVAEGVNRVAIYYNALVFQIAGNYASRPLAPGTISILYPAGAGVTFAAQNTPFSGSLPLPTEIADIQVLLNDQPVPLYFAGPLQVNFLVPMSAPDSGTAELQVVRKSTGQILAVSTPQFARVAPALFVQDAAAQGQIAALNQDNTVNSPSNPAAKGSIIQIFATGQGFVPNAPPDGSAPTGEVRTTDKPQVYLGGPNFVKPEDVTYSGLAPSLVGVWQINARVPEDAAPGQNIAFITMYDVPSNQLPNTGQRIQTVYSVKP